MQRKLSKTTTLTLSVLLGSIALACSGGTDDPSSSVDDEVIDSDDDEGSEEGAEEVTDEDPSEDEDSDEMDETQDGMGGEGSDDEPEEPTIPEVVSSWPADGDAGFLFDDSFVVTFSVPMNEASVEAHYASLALPSESVSFSWNEESTELTIDPNENLGYGSGTIPEDIPLYEYAFAIGAEAESLDGEALGESLEVTFSTARAVIQYLDPTTLLSGSARTDGYETGTIHAGDSGQTDNEELVIDWWYVGLVSFDLSALPGEIVQVNWAQLGMTQAVNNGTPFDVLGGAVYLYDVSFTERDFASINAQMEVPMLTLSDSAADTNLLVNVGDAVVADFEAGNPTQFSLAFATGTDDDGLADSTVYSDVSLKVNYFIE